MASPSDDRAAATERARQLAGQLRLLRRLRDRYGVSLNYENILRDNYLRFLAPGAIVIDVGAHVGEHLERFLEKAAPDGYVHAFEAVPSLADALRERFRDRSHLLEVHNVALSDYEGTSEFVFAAGTPGESGLKQRRFNRPDLARPQQIEVRVRRLDDCVGDLPRLDYIKMDIEGGEIDCIRGARATIARHRPILSIEYGVATYSAYGHQQRTLWDVAREIGYGCVDIFGNRLDSLDEWCRACDQVYWDYYLVPREKLGFFASKVDGTL